jgi:hypothetical protein
LRAAVRNVAGLSPFLTPASSTALAPRMAALSSAILERACSTALRVSSLGSFGLRGEWNGSRAAGLAELRRRGLGGTVAAHASMRRHGDPFSAIEGALLVLGSASGQCAAHLTRRLLGVLVRVLRRLRTTGAGFPGDRGASLLGEAGLAGLACRLTLGVADARLAVVGAA